MLFSQNIGQPKFKCCSVRMIKFLPFKSALFYASTKRIQIPVWTICIHFLKDLNSLSCPWEIKRAVEES